MALCDAVIWDRIWPGLAGFRLKPDPSAAKPLACFQHSVGCQGLCGLGGVMLLVLLGRKCCDRWWASRGTSLVERPVGRTENGSANSCRYTSFAPTTPA